MYPIGDPSPKMWEADIFHPLESGTWSNLFLAISLEKEYPKLGFKILGAPKKFTGGQS